jgi:hypothetical protein
MAEVAELGKMNQLAPRVLASDGDFAVRETIARTIRRNVRALKSARGLFDRSEV